MKKTYILMLSAICCVKTYGQTAKADTLFEHLEYYKASKLYEKKAVTHPSTDIYFKLGECYRKMNLYKDELAAFDKVNSAGTYSKSEFYLDYGQVLKNNGKYPEAKIAFDKYTELMPNDPRGKFFSESIDIVTADHNSDETIKISDVTTLNSADADFSPVLYKDGVVFTSSRKSVGHNKIFGWTGTDYLQLYYAKKGNNDTIYSDVATFGGKVIDQKYHDGPACFSKSFDTLYTSRVEKDLKGEEKKTLKIERNKIFMSTFKDSKWSKVIPFPFNSDTFSVANPFLTTDGSRLYFVSDMPGGYGKTDIYYCNREGTSWSKPINMGASINTFNREKFPSIAADGNFYFASDGYQGFGGLDICVALNTGGAFAKAIPMKYPFNSFTDDYAIMFLKDGKTGYISSNRYVGGLGDDDIFYFDLPHSTVDSSLHTSMYTIGYQRKPPIEVLATKTPETADTVIAAIVPQTVKKSVPFELRVYFDFDKFNIRADAVNRLDSVVSYMKASPEMKLVIGGHCDNKGTPEYNMILSNHRDDAVVKYLKAKGINSKRIVATGYGLTQMVNRCLPGVECSDVEEQLNRRVEFYFEEDTTEKHSEQKTTSSKQKIYTVQWGDTLYSLSKKYNITVQELKEMNKLTGETVSVGQKLIVSY
jgi:outer membrane protein OmpA-like peptidoglycan-associated protein